MNEPSGAWAVYALEDPRTGRIRYVGCASNLTKRLTDHVAAAHSARERHTQKAKWLRRLTRAGLRPVVLVLERGPGDWADAEERWISRLRAEGLALLNVTRGGKGTRGVLRSPRCAELLRAAMVAYWERMRLDPVAFAARTAHARAAGKRSADGRAARGDWSANRRLALSATWREAVTRAAQVRTRRPEWIANNKKVGERNASDPTWREKISAGQKAGGAAKIAAAKKQYWKEQKAKNPEAVAARVAAMNRARLAKLAAKVG